MTRRQPASPTPRAAFTVIPAVDIRGGKCVRLLHGDYNQETAYSDDPVAVACRWQDLGAPLVHVVDLDGARAGHPVNDRIVEAICRALSVPVEVSGGIRTLEAVREAISWGAGRVQLGSAAVRDPGLVQSACAEYGEAMIVSIDARDGEVMTDGWTRGSGLRAIDLGRRMAALGVPRIMYTDIARDGAMQGPNLDALREMVAAVPIPVVASGGISTVDQLRQVIATGCEGAIIGKALYEGQVDLREALAVARTADQGLRTS
jgi:phosphoribosylformimino-5-aminoimidazole carboxamide ribotide isomerase